MYCNQRTHKKTSWHLNPITSVSNQCSILENKKKKFSQETWFQRATTHLNDVSNSGSVSLFNEMSALCVCVGGLLDANPSLLKQQWYNLVHNWEKGSWDISQGYLS